MNSLRVPQFALSGGRRVFKSLSSSISRIKPVFNWIDPGLRSRMKQALSNWVFQTFYPPTSPAGIDKTNGNSLAGHHNSGPSSERLQSGVNLIGFPRARIGEGEFLRQTARSLQRAGVEIGMVEFPSALDTDAGDERFASHLRPDNPYNINMFLLKPDQVPAAVVSRGEEFLRGRYNIGYWTWELPELPEEWSQALGFLDEVWCPSRFIQSAVQARSSGPRPVHASGH